MEDPTRAWRRIVTALVVFGISFGYLEAAVVSYLRAIYDPLRHQLHPDRPVHDLFPLISIDQLRDAGPEHYRRVGVEVGREAATLIMLASVALAAARNRRQWLAAFAIAFGVWDIAFYGGLKLLLDWPASLSTWDILFLIPVPWVGPVLSPILVSVSMIAAGLFVLRRDLAGALLPFRWFQWALIFSGALIVVLAFTWDYRNTLAAGMPNPFNWPLFFMGELIGLSSLLFNRSVKRI